MKYFIEIGCVKLASYHCTRRTMYFDAFVTCFNRGCRTVECVQSPNSVHASVCEMTKMEEKRDAGSTGVVRWNVERDILAQKDAGSLWSKLSGMRDEGTACVAAAQKVESNLLSWIRLWILYRGVWAAVRLVAPSPSSVFSFLSLSLSSPSPSTLALLSPPTL